MAEVEVAQQQADVQDATGENKRHCDFYITPRGCIKGDSCDFMHPVAPNGTVTTRTCDFFKSPRGCAKNKDCDFLHIDGLRPSAVQPGGMGMMGMGGGMGGGGGGMVAPAGQKICSFFNSPRGCIKGAECDFYHPPAGQQQQQQQQGMPMDGGMMGGQGSGRGQGKPCDYFFSARGCVKGNECDFSHVNPAMQAGGFGAPQMYGQQMQGMMPMMGQQRPGMDMMGRPTFGAGAVEKKPQKCDFFSSERGCIKGELCDFIHTKEKVCDFYLSDRGCRKGKFCDFQHPDDGTGAATDAGEAGADRTKARAKRYAPY